ncbi:peptidylprolyl isomerase [Marinobacter sp.]|uniref:peptidylprolyl isomerase n=1 Tax=Marinobacter sp. TaxID=50741 RepID=UPI00356669CE
MDFCPRIKLFPLFSGALPVVLGAILTFSAMFPAHAQSSGASDEPMPQVRVSTTEGAFNIRLRPDIAPKTVANFLQYVDDGFYDGTLFHRVIPGFMAQAGGFDQNMNRKDTRDPIENESSQTARNLRGTIAMARTADPDSATAQFFINLVDNPHLDATRARTGYTVFGSVTEGMGVIDAIGKVETTRRNGMGDVPVKPVVIESIKRVETGQ